jgi:tRNA threonylcarbamoyladenosine biosynthesis protein TsaB
MITLAIEASGKLGSVAVLDGADVLSSVRFAEGLFHGREIVPRIKEALEKAGKTFADIGTVAVSAGPGSYTGLRVSLAGAKTMAWALGANLVGVPTLDAIAENAPTDADRVAVAINAGRKEVYACLYKREDGTLQRKMDYVIIQPAKFAEDLKKLGRAYLVGDAVAVFPEAWKDADFDLCKPDEAAARAETIGRLALKTAPESTPHNLAPLYLRKSAAEEKIKNPSPGFQPGETP